MNTFRKLVTNVSSGTAPVSRLKFYSKRLAQEAATRRIATVLMVALLLFQIVVILLPPTSAKANQCSSNNIIQPCGITDTSNQGVVNAFKGGGDWGANASQLLAQIGVSEQDVLNGTPNQQVCKGQNPLSMGRQQGAGSWLYPGHNDIWVGPASSRWLQDCFSAELLGNKVRGSDIGTGDPNQWYQVGILYDCGNLVFIPTTPPQNPKTISCSNLNTSATSVTVGQPIVVAGYAHGDNLPSGDLVDMAYGAYDSGTNNLVGGLPQNPLLSQGIPYDANNNFIDNSGKSFTFNNPGTYDIRLLVAYNNQDNQKVFAPGSAVGACQMQVTVGAQPTIVCQNLAVNPTTLQGGSPITMTGTAQQVNENNPNELADFEYYIREKRADGSFDDSTVDAKGRHMIPADGMLPNGSGQYTDTRPPASNPNDTFFMPVNTTNTAKTYQIFLRVFWRGHTAVSDGFSVPNCTKLVTVPPLPTSFACQNLKADQTNGNVPLDVNFDATGVAQNTTVSAFNFDFGDGQKQTVNTTQTTAKAAHKYTKGGKYTASVTMTTALGTTSPTPACQATIVVNETDFAKVVANITLLTSNGQPSDANGAVARAGDQLRYSIGVQNKGGDAVKGFVFDDDITDILAYADVVDAGGAQVVKQGATTRLVWAPVDIPVGANGNPGTVTKQFTVKIKDPIPFVTQTATDLPGMNDCQLTDTFHSKVVVTPLGVNINKQIECTTKSLPQTGAGWSIVVMAALAAISFFLLLRNRLLRRELQLVETLTEGA